MKLIINRIGSTDLGYGYHNEMIIVFDTPDYEFLVSDANLVDPIL